MNTAHRFVWLKIDFAINKAFTHIFLLWFSVVGFMYCGLEIFVYTLNSALIFKPILQFNRREILFLLAFQLKNNKNKIVRQSRTNNFNTYLRCLTHKHFFMFNNMERGKKKNICARKCTCCQSNWNLRTHLS